MFLSENHLVNGKFELIPNKMIKVLFFHIELDFHVNVFCLDVRNPFHLIDYRVLTSDCTIDLDPGPNDE